MAAFAAYVLLLAGIIFAAYRQLIPQEVLPLPYGDTLGHFGLIGMAAFLLELAWGHRRLRLPRAILGRTSVSAAMLTIATASALEEGAQLFSHTRTFDVIDLGANLAGVICFTWAAQFLTAERQRYDSFATFARRSFVDLLQFVGKLALALIFPLTIFAALAATRRLDFPLLGLHRYDFLLLLCIGVQALLIMTKLESPGELKVITWFHILGLAMELFKVRAGSWAYPEPAWTKFGGVPLFSGFMYASVASFLIQVWHRLDLRMERWPHRLLVVPLGVAIYLNFFTHHFVADLRWFLILAVALLFFRTRMVATNTDKARAIPLVGTFAGLGFFIWIAENLGTFLGAWAYPNQREQWQLVHIGKINVWFLLSIISFLLVAQLKLQARRTD